MALRAVKNKEKGIGRFKAVFYSLPGVGKTHFCCSFPNTYYIDTEGLHDYLHFIDMVESKGGNVVYLTELTQIIEEVGELLKGGHDYKTLVIDSISFPYLALSNVEAERLTAVAKRKGEEKEGIEYAAHKAKSARLTQQLGILLTKLDMNVIVTAHEKVKYEKGIETGKTFDVTDKLSYALGTTIQLRQMGKSVKAYIEKTRYPKLPRWESIDFSDGYNKMCEKLGLEMFTREVKNVELGTVEEVAEIGRLVNVLHVPVESVNEWLLRANSNSFEDMPRKNVLKCIEFLNNKIKGA